MGIIYTLHFFAIQRLKRKKMTFDLQFNKISQSDFVGTLFTWKITFFSIIIHSFYLCTNLFLTFIILVLRFTRLIFEMINLWLDLVWLALALTEPVTCPGSTKVLRSAPRTDLPFVMLLSWSFTRPGNNVDIL